MPINASLEEVLYKLKTKEDDSVKVHTFQKKVEKIKAYQTPVSLVVHTLRGYQIVNQNQFILTSYNDYDIFEVDEPKLSEYSSLYSIRLQEMLGKITKDMFFHYMDTLVLKGDWDKGVENGMVSYSVNGYLKVNTSNFYRDTKVDYKDLLCNIVEDIAEFYKVPTYTIILRILTASGKNDYSEKFFHKYVDTTIPSVVCSPDYFFSNYRILDDPNPKFNFSKALDLLQSGFSVSREVWVSNKNTIPYLTYCDGSIILDMNDTSINGWSPSQDDMFADDWFQVDPDYSDYLGDDEDLEQDKKEMLKVTDDFLSSLANASSEGDIQPLRDRLDLLTAKFSGNPAYYCLLKMKLLEKESEIFSKDKKVSSSGTGRV